MQKQPKQYDQGSSPHAFAAPKEYFRQQHFEACDLMLGELLEKSNYNNDFDYRKLRSRLALLPDTIRLADSSIKKVTSIRTTCNAMNTQRVFKTMLSEVHKLLRMYLTILITTATCERTFSAVRHVLTYKRFIATIKQLFTTLHSQEID